MSLPPELVEEILTHLQHDKRTLWNCSLVAKSWAYPGQKFLFASVSLTPGVYNKRQENASPTRTRLLRHVRTLTCHGFSPLGVLQDDYLRSLHRLRHLALRGHIRVEPITPNSLPAFQDTISSLSLYGVSLAWSTFVGLVDSFPNLRDLHFIHSDFVPDRSPAPLLSRPPRGKLCLSTLQTYDFGLLSRGISALEPEYDQLEVVYMLDRTPSHIQQIVSACEKTLTHIKLDLSGWCCLPTLESCSELRELVLAQPLRTAGDLSLVRSITSTNIQKIILIFEQWALTKRRRSSLDIALSDLVYRLHTLGYEHTLELELRPKFESSGVELYTGFDKLFPRFREKGRVTVKGNTDGKILYQSDG